MLNRRQRLEMENRLLRYALQKWLKADEELEMACDPECWEPPHPNPEQMRAQFRASQNVTIAKEKAKQVAAL